MKPLVRVCEFIMKNTYWLHNMIKHTHGFYCVFCIYSNNKYMNYTCFAFWVCNTIFDWCKNWQLNGRSEWKMHFWQNWLAGSMILSMYHAVMISTSDVKIFKSKIIFPFFLFMVNYKLNIKSKNITRKISNITQK